MQILLDFSGLGGGGERESSRFLLKIEGGGLGSEEEVEGVAQGLAGCAWGVGGGGLKMFWAGPNIQNGTPQIIPGLLPTVGV